MSYTAFQTAHEGHMGKCNGNVTTALERIVGARVATCQPGDGTSYRAIAVRIKGDATLGGVLGGVKDGWLVTLAHNGRSYLVSHEQYIDPTYAQDKFHVLDGDAVNVARLVTLMVADKWWPEDTSAGSVEDKTTDQHSDVRREGDK